MEDEKRKEILRELVLSEEDTIKKYKDLIKKSRELFAIDGRNGKVVFEPRNFQNNEKITLYLIAKYFANELGLSKKSKFKSGEIAAALEIKQTTLSGPLSKLVSSGYVSNEDGNFFVNHYKIEEILDSLILKYENYQKKARPGLSFSNARTSNEKPTKKKQNTGVGKQKQEVELSSVKFSLNPKGIEDLSKDLGVSEEKVKLIFEFESDGLHLLKKKHYNNDSDESFNNSLIFLTGLYYHSDVREINGRLLLSYLKNANVSIGNHFKRDMGRKDRRSYLLNKGNSYKITENGIKLGISLIRGMLGE